MRYAIFADIHANVEAFDAVIDAYKKERIDQYLFLGDVAGYGANPKECIAKLRRLRAVAIVGNHDWAAINLLSLNFFAPEAKESLLWTRKALNRGAKVFLESLKLIFKNNDLTLAHASLDHARDFNYLTDAYMAEETFRLLGEKNICFVGHTHIAGIFSKDAAQSISFRNAGPKLTLDENTAYIVNVGSVSHSRDGDPRAAYCVYDTENKTVEIKRAGYNVTQAANKIIKAGLPRVLAERLLTGK